MYTDAPPFMCSQYLESDKAQIGIERFVYLGAQI